MTSSPLESLFSPFWLASQILPEGYHSVVSLVSPGQAARQVRPVSSRPASPFSVLGALCNPGKFKEPSLAQGYAKLTVNITKGIAEVYDKNDETNELLFTQADSAVPRKFSGSPSLNVPRKLSGGAVSSCCADPDDIRGSPPLEFGDSTESLAATALGTPPFFPIVRMYLNDKGVYQTRVINLGSRLTPTDEIGFDAKSGLNIISDWTSSPEKNVIPGSGQLRLRAVHDLSWDEEIQLFVHSPSSVLTLQLFEKDFCPDLSLSESLLTSMTIPVAPLIPNQNIHIIMDVCCTLPEAYSIESITSNLAPPPRKSSNIANFDEAITSLKAPNDDTAFHGDSPVHANGKSQSDWPATPGVLMPPHAISCKLLIQLRLEIPGNPIAVALREVAALSLPKTCWTPEPILDFADPRDHQITILSESDVFGIWRRAHEPLSLLEFFKCCVVLVQTIRDGIVAKILDDEEVESLGVDPTNFTNSLAEIGIKLANSENQVSYLALFEDITFLFNQIFLGPALRLQSWVKDIVSFRSPLVAAVSICCLWLPIFLGPQGLSIYFFLFSLMLSIVLTEVHWPVRSPTSKENSLSRFYEKLRAIKAAPMLVKPIEDALMKPQVLLSIRFFELWTKVMKKRLEIYEKAQDSSYSDDLRDASYQVIQRPVEGNCDSRTGLVNHSPPTYFVGDHHETYYAIHSPSSWRQDRHRIGTRDSEVLPSEEDPEICFPWICESSKERGRARENLRGVTDM